jgi:uncharacterized protein (TIGR02118 family)
MSVKLLVLYPTPRDPEEFDRRYEREHLPMGKENLIGATGLASHRILGSPAGKSPFARLTEVSFPTLKAVQECAALPGAQKTMANGAPGPGPSPAPSQDGKVHVLPDPADHRSAQARDHPRGRRLVHPAVVVEGRGRRALPGRDPHHHARGVLLIREGASPKRGEAPLPFTLRPSADRE